MSHTFFLIQRQRVELDPPQHVLTLSCTARPAAAGGSAPLPANSCSNTAPERPAGIPQRWEAARCVSPTPFMSPLGSFSPTTSTKLPEPTQSPAPGTLGRSPHCSAGWARLSPGLARLLAHSCGETGSSPPPGHCPSQPGLQIWCCGRRAAVYPSMYPHRLPMLSKPAWKLEA